MALRSGSWTFTAVLLAAGCATSDSMATAKSGNRVLVAPNGVMSYRFDLDTAGSGKSACNDRCALDWPPFAASGSAGDFTIVARDDGTRQWACKGQPLYYSAKDRQPVDDAGAGVNDRWRAARE